MILLIKIMKNNKINRTRVINKLRRFHKDSLILSRKFKKNRIKKITNPISQIKIKIKKTILSSLNNSNSNNKMENKSNKINQAKITHLFNKKMKNKSKTANRKKSNIYKI